MQIKFLLIQNTFKNGFLFSSSLKEPLHKIVTLSPVFAIINRIRLITLIGGGIMVLQIPKAQDLPKIIHQNLIKVSTESVLAQLYFVS